MPRHNFLLKLAYDGSGFAGWQRGAAGGPRTVQAEVEAALGRLLGEAVEIVGASRTDAGVHAEGQAASFHSRTELGPDALVSGLGALLPEDCRCLSCREVDPRFHARFRAKAKLYRYRLQTGPRPDPALRPYSLHVPEALDLEAMAEAGRLLAGSHDFRAFSNAKGEAEGRRRLDEVTVAEAPGRVDLLFKGQGFLYNQVRIMASALLEVGRARLSSSDIAAALDEGLAARVRMPGALGAFGLCLVEVYF
jgi:tRNA pseudouridine38-40 synthase